MLEYDRIKAEIEELRVEAQALKAAEQGPRTLVEQG
jgi:hypothetical protein